MTEFEPITNPIKLVPKQKYRTRGPRGFKSTSSNNTKKVRCIAWHLYQSWKARGGNA